MERLKASYFLDKSEVRFLISCTSDLEPTVTAQCFSNEYLSNSITAIDTPEGLIFKGLAKMQAGKLIVEPVIELLIKSIMSVNVLWSVKCADIETPVLIMKTRELFMLIMDYALTADTWKVTPYQNRNELIHGLQDEYSIVQISKIDQFGKTQTIKPDNEFNWLKEDTDGEIFC